jgi:flagellar motor switch protein FliN/FliY
MSQINRLASFLDAFAGELQGLLSTRGAAQVTVSWNQDRPDSRNADLVWWSCSLSVDSACRIATGADKATWRDVGGTDGTDARFDDPNDACFGVLTKSIEQVAKARFGALVSCEGFEISDVSPQTGTSTAFTIGRLGAEAATIFVSVSPDLAAALGGENRDRDVAQLVDANRTASYAANPIDILHQVEMPVSVSFGRTHMQLKDLLALANGSVVQLDREVGDEVELRVNNCVIARGEVVDVDGNYGVRILEIASSRTGQGIRGGAD